MQVSGSVLGCLRKVQQRSNPWGKLPLVPCISLHLLLTAEISEKCLNELPALQQGTYRSLVINDFARHD